MSESKAVKLLIGYMHPFKTEDAFAASIRAFGAGASLINVEKRHHSSRGFAVYTNAAHSFF